MTVREHGREHLADAIAIIARGMRDNPLHVSALGYDTRTRADRLDRMFALEELKLPVSRPFIDAEIGVEGEDSWFLVNLGASDQTRIGERDRPIRILPQ